MAMIPKQIAKIVEDKVFTALNAEFGSLTSTNEDVSEQWRKQAKIHAAAAEAIIQAILSMGQVAPGIPTAGGPASQVTIAPGKLQ
jgi:hypothetical protein